MNVTLAGNKDLSGNQARIKSKGTELGTHRGRPPRQHGCRSWGDGLQAEGCQNGQQWTTEAKRGPGWILPHALEKNQLHPTPPSWTSGLWNCESKLLLFQTTQSVVLGTVVLAS